MERRQFVKSIVASAFAAGHRPLFASSSLARPILPFAASAGTNGFRGPGEREFFYRPLDAWAADFIPYFHDGQFHLFYLLDWRDRAKHGEGTPWYQVTTKDFVHFEERGEMLPRGGKNDQDLYVFTGSVVQGEGQHHIFYTGHNPHFPAQGKPEEGVMHAVSDDLLHWRKVPEDTFYAPTDRFERDDWRDPFVFWNQEAGEYWMLLAARLKTGPSRRRGCTALCASKDLRKWEVRDPFWAPHLYYTHECPDLFRIGDWWYLVFSEFTDLVRTRYRKSRSLAGPWIAPEWDYFDAKAFYAAKTASDGRNRFLFGWDPTRSKKDERSLWDWGGNLIVHQLKQEADGILAVGIPPTVDQAWTRRLEQPFSLQFGKVTQGTDRIDIDATESFACAAAGTMPDRCKIEAQVRFDAGTRGCGVMLRTRDDLEKSYYIRLEPENNRLVFDRWPRVPPGGSALGNYEDHMAGLDRGVHLRPNTPIDLTVIVDRTLAVVYVGGRTAMSLRMYEWPAGRWGFFAKQGRASFQNIRLSTL